MTNDTTTDPSGSENNVVQFRRDTENGTELVDLGDPLDKALIIESYLEERLSEPREILSVLRTTDACHGCCGRYGYRRIAALLRDAGWLVNDKRVERLWRKRFMAINIGDFQ